MIQHMLNELLGNPEDEYHPEGTISIAFHPRDQNELEVIMDALALSRLTRSNSWVVHRDPEMKHSWIECWTPSTSPHPERIVVHGPWNQAANVFAEWEIPDAD